MITRRIKVVLPDSSVSAYNPHTVLGTPEAQVRERAALIRIARLLGRQMAREQREAAGCPAPPASPNIDKPPT